jgi:hypothetical protein
MAIDTELIRLLQACHTKQHAGHVTTGIRIVNADQAGLRDEHFHAELSKNWVKATIRSKLSLSVVSVITSHANTVRFAARHGNIYRRK